MDKKSLMTEAIPEVNKDFCRPHQQHILRLNGKLLSYYMNYKCYSVTDYSCEEAVRRLPT